MSADLTPEKQQKVPGVPFTKNDPRINLAGRPKGSLSVIGKLKQIWEEQPEEFERFVDEYRKDPMSRRHITEMIDGKPSQDVAVKADLTINVVDYTKYGSDDTSQL